jgi:hypothetical protein
VAACHAMRNLLEKRQNRFYHDYTVIVAAGERRRDRRGGPAAGAGRGWTILLRLRQSHSPAAS